MLCYQSYLYIYKKLFGFTIMDFDVKCQLLILHP
jgi:hypothetical protein